MVILSADQMLQLRLMQLPRREPAKQISSKYMALPRIRGINERTIQLRSKLCG